MLTLSLFFIDKKGKEKKKMKQEREVQMNFRMLNASEIDCRINTINEKGLTLLLYKDARVDQNILDETVGNMNWQRDHKELKENIYCGISIWNNELKQWITKWDCGKESFSESEKGEASDSFKRAGFNWGIGRELYSSPFIWISKDNANIYKSEKNDKFTCYDKFRVNHIEYNENREIIELSILNDTTGVIVFDFKAKTKVENINKLELLKKIKKLMNDKNVLSNEPSEHFGKSSNEMTVDELKQVVKWLEEK